MLGSSSTTKQKGTSPDATGGEATIGVVSSAEPVAAVLVIDCSRAEMGLQRLNDWKGISGPNALNLGC